MFVSGACARSVSSPGRLVDPADELVDGVLGLGPLLRLREERVAHAVLAVHVGGVDPVGDERLRAARVDGHALPRLLDRVERVLDLLLEVDVAVADRDRLELRVRVEQRDQERRDVVARGVGVDDQTFSHWQPRLELGAGRQPGDDACVLDHVRAGGAAPADRVEVGQPLGERDREGGVEGVARAGRVDCGCGERGHADAVELCALLAEREHDRGAARRAPRRLPSRSASRSRPRARSARVGAGAGFRIVRTPARRATSSA